MHHLSCRLLLSASCCIHAFGKLLSEFPQLSIKYAMKSFWIYKRKSLAEFHNFWHLAFQLLTSLDFINSYAYIFREQFKFGLILTKPRVFFCLLEINYNRNCILCMRNFAYYTFMPWHKPTPSPPHPSPFELPCYWSLPFQFVTFAEIISLSTVTATHTHISATYLSFALCRWCVLCVANGNASAASDR